MAKNVTDVCFKANNSIVYTNHVDNAIQHNMYQLYPALEKQATFVANGTIDVWHIAHVALSNHPSEMSPRIRDKRNFATHDCSFSLNNYVLINIVLF